MISDTPLIIDLLQGVERRIGEDGDAQFTVPSVGVVSIPLATPTLNVGGSGAGTQRNSLCGQSEFTLTNGGFVLTNLVTLTKGLWRINLDLTTLFNFTATAGARTSVNVMMAYQGVTLALLKRMAFIGSFRDYVSFLILINSALDLTHRSDTNSVGQTSDSSIYFQCDKLL